MSKAKDVNLVTACFWLVISCWLWVIVGIFGCLVASLGVVIFQGEKSGIDMLQNLLKEDYSYFLLIANPNINLSINSWFNLLRDWTSLPEWLWPSQFSDVKNYIDTIYKMLWPYLTALSLGVNLLVIRLYLLLRWCPLFLLLGLIGLVDGLVQRSIRRAQAGRESALIYHQSKFFILLSMGFSVFVTLALPISWRKTEWILVMSAILFGVALQITAKSFKKYL